MTPDQRLFTLQLIAGFFAPRYTESASSFCERTLHFDEPDNRGPYTLAGREYAREPLDSFTDDTVTDGVGVFGSQSGKTGIIMGGAACIIKNEPSRIFWVMPTRDTVSKFARTRWMPFVRASMPELIPKGAKRHDFSTFVQQIGNSIVDMVWSNSPAALASVPARVVILDEVDKFAEGGKKEADALNLAQQRTKRFSNPKRYYFSTPTIVEGLIWQELLKSDMRRRFLPCPHCHKHVVFAWSAAYTVLPKTGAEAYVAWDKEAKRKDGDWDLDRVERSARFACPHCGGHIRDDHKTSMDRDGVWKPTKTTQVEAGYRGWHLPSLYASSAQTNVGKLAVKFLQQKHSLLGLQGFINGDLAEPYQSQDRQAERVELITSRIEVTAEWTKAMMVDCQQKSPLFWFVIRAWNGGDSTGVFKGHCDTWDEVVDAQNGQKVQDGCVMVDSGFGARSESDVYLECARHAELVDRSIAEPPLRPLWVGWLPAKGFPVRKRWKDKATGLEIPYTIREVDPFYGTTGQGESAMPLFEFSGDIFADILDNLRSGKGGYKWQVEESVADDEYWSHLDAEIKDAQFNPKTGKTVYQWRLINRHRLNHLKDCERMQIAYASFQGWFKVDWSK